MKLRGNLISRPGSTGECDSRGTSARWIWGPVQGSRHGTAGLLAFLGTSLKCCMTLHEIRLSIKTKKLTYVSFLIKTISFEQWKRWRNKKVCVCSRTFDWIIFVLVSHIETRSQVPQADQDPDIEVNKNDKWNEAWKYREVRSE